MEPSLMHTTWIKERAFWCGAAWLNLTIICAWFQTLRNYCSVCIDYVHKANLHIHVPPILMNMTLIPKLDLHVLHSSKFTNLIHHHQHKHNQIAEMLEDIYKTLLIIITCNCSCKKFIWVNSLYPKKMVQSEFFLSRYDLCWKCMCIWYHVKAE